MRRLVARPSAFALEPFLDTGVMVRFGSHLLSGGKLGVVVWGGHGGQIALAQINSQDLRQDFGRGVRGSDRERDEQIEVVFGAVIPEFGSANGGALLEQSQMATPALIGEDDTTSQRQHAHLPGPF